MLKSINEYLTEADATGVEEENPELRQQKIAQLLARFENILQTTIKSPELQKSLRYAVKMAPQEMGELLLQLAGATGGTASRLQGAVKALSTPTPLSTSA